MASISRWFQPIAFMVRLLLVIYVPSHTCLELTDWLNFRGETLSTAITWISKKERCRSIFMEPAYCLLAFFFSLSILKWDLYNILKVDLFYLFVFDYRILKKYIYLTPPFLCKLHCILNHLFSLYSPHYNKDVLT